MDMISGHLSWWITVIEIPVITGILWLIWQGRIQNEEALDAMQKRLDHRSDQLREGLSAFKLEVAKTYASHTDLRDLETRLVGHLLRIESKLDSTALRTAALKGRKDVIS